MQTIIKVGNTVFIWLRFYLLSQRGYFHTNLHASLLRKQESLFELSGLPYEESEDEALDNIRKI